MPRKKKKRRKPYKKQVRPDADELKILLWEHDGNLAGIAKIHKVSRQTVYNWCLKHEIDPNLYRPEKDEPWAFGKGKEKEPHE